MVTKEHNKQKLAVATAIDEVLSEMGESTSESVMGALYGNHRCLLSDCYDHPEYLKSALRDIFGDSHSTILLSIKDRLKKYMNNKPIDSFYINIPQLNYS